MTDSHVSKEALIIIDMQMMVQHRIDAGQDHVNAEAPARIVELSQSFRAKGLPVIHVRHRDDILDSPAHADAPGYPPMPCDEALEGEPVLLKKTSSAFASTELEAYLRANNIADLIVTGAVAGYCVSSTVRAAADLGFRVTVVRDAVIGFDLPAAGFSARTAFDVTMAQIEPHFARIIESSALLQE